MENNNWIERLKLEYYYYTKRPWSLTDVGIFWDSVDDYDQINEKLYTYFKRFTNTHEMIEKLNINLDDFKKILDIQTRSGKGTKFWSEKLEDPEFHCVDFSNGLLEKARKRLKNIKNIHYELVEKSNFNLNKIFDLILCYETVEHVYDYDVFISSLAGHLKKDGIIILTCPNVSWEIIHWLTAIVGFNHSEGPHRFIRKKKLEEVFKQSRLQILSYNTTIFFPFNNKLSIKLDTLFTKYMPKYIKELIMLRHSYILKKQ
tara:strand:- start:118 stop:894 length:777 start_codon:yes stop_codon:yes gene_type:complete